MNKFTTAHEAQEAIKRVTKANTGCEVHEVHNDVGSDRNWYVYVLVPLEDGKKKCIYRCKWSSPIVRFK